MYQQLTGLQREMMKKYERVIGKILIRKHNVILVKTKHDTKTSRNGITVPARFCVCAVSAAL